MESTSDVDVFFSALETLNFGQVFQVGGGWMFSYSPDPTEHTDGLRQVVVRLYVTDDEITYEKLVDGQKRQYQHPSEAYTDFDLDNFVLTGDEDIEYRYEITDQGATTFEFEIVVDGDTYYGFFHEEI